LWMISGVVAYSHVVMRAVLLRVDSYTHRVAYWYG
jgi:hypothetical protein